MLPCQLSAKLILRRLPSIVEPFPELAGWVKVNAQVAAKHFHLTVEFSDLNGEVCALHRALAAVALKLFNKRGGVCGRQHINLCPQRCVFAFKPSNVCLGGSKSF